MPDAILSEAQTSESSDALKEPSSEGLALMGSALHGDALMAALEALSRHFRNQPGPRPFMALHQPLCHDPKDLRRHVIPDLLVAHEGWDRSAPAYHLWEAPTPHFVLEIASRSTVDRELGFKKGEYERLGVLEYWQLDQSGTLLPKPLLGHRLTEQGYRELRPSGEVDGRETYYSEALGLLLRSRGQRLGLKLVFRDPHSGEDILFGEEMDQALESIRSARLTAETERNAHLAAEAERSARLAADRAAEAERSARLAMERAAEAERSARRAIDDRLAQVDEELRRGLTSTGSDLD